jgi:preprotein translocase SecE subunit
VARDRQRAKQRRRRQSGSGGASGSARTRARDAARPSEPTEAREPTAAPEPTEDAFPDVEEARRAEAGAPLRDDEGDASPRDDEALAETGDSPRDDEALADGVYPDEVYGDDVESAPDELEPPSAYAPDPAVAEERAAARPRRKRGKILTFLGHVIDELRRVQWPDRRQTAQGTAVTLGFVVIAGGFLGLMDAVWKPVVEAIL